MKATVALIHSDGVANCLVLPPTPHKRASRQHQIYDFILQNKTIMAALVRNGFLK